MLDHLLIANGLITNFSNLSGYPALGVIPPPYGHGVPDHDFVPAGDIYPGGIYPFGATSTFGGYGAGAGPGPVSGSGPVGPLGTGGVGAGHTGPVGGYEAGSVSVSAVPAGPLILPAIGAARSTDGLTLGERGMLTSRVSDEYYDRLDDIYVRTKFFESWLWTEVQLPGAPGPDG